MFLVITESPLDEQWEERDRRMMEATGRPPYFSGSTCYQGMRQRDHEWHVDTFEKAQQVKEALQSVDRVTVFVREQ